MGRDRSIGKTHEELGTTARKCEDSTEEKPRLATRKIDPFGVPRRFANFCQ
jgi:hypothetical protein